MEIFTHLVVKQWNVPRGFVSIVKQIQYWCSIRTRACVLVWSTALCDHSSLSYYMYYRICLMLLVKSWRLGRNRRGMWTMIWTKQKTESYQIQRKLHIKTFLGQDCVSFYFEFHRLTFPAFNWISVWSINFMFHHLQIIR